MELLIRVRNNGKRKLGRGDLVVSCIDGWKWGTAGLTNPDWRILVSPITQVECDMLSMRKPDFWRRFNLDAAMPKGLATFLADDHRNKPKMTVPAQWLRSLIVKVK